MIFQAGNFQEGASLFSEKKNVTKDSRAGLETTTQMVQYTTLTIRPLRIWWTEGK